jgi:hypothetical protein
MPKKTHRKRPQRGRGVLRDAAKFVKDNRLISRGLSMVPHPADQGLGWAAKQVGLGQTPQRGNGIFSDIGSGIGSIAHGFFG